jgi:hypothetical protein
VHAHLFDGRRERAVAIILASVRRDSVRLRCVQTGYVEVPNHMYGGNTLRAWFEPKAMRRSAVDCITKGAPVEYEALQGDYDFDDGVSSVRHTPPPFLIRAMR